MLDGGLLTAALDEKVGKELAALFGQEARGDFDLVVELGVVHDGEDGAAGTGFGVGGGVDEALDTGVEDGSCAHGAGFEGDVEGTAFFAVAGGEAVVLQGLASLAEGDYFCVGGGIVVAEDAVVAAGYDRVLIDDDGSDGDLACGFGGLSLGYGVLHRVNVEIIHC
jgi:hypothetical protein